MKQRILPFLLLGALCAACSSEPDVTGLWRNGDGSEVRFLAKDSAALGQQGFGDVLGCAVDYAGDTVIVIEPVDPASQSKRSYRFLLSGDTLHLREIATDAPGTHYVEPIDQLARRAGKSLEKLAFIRVEEAK
ncbi:MAG TPA: hypothetical protein PK916_09450 [Bacteroidota bacterium]|nr:hypothetical protein [Bacteroidota bacterium]